MKLALIIFLLTGAYFYFRKISTPPSYKQYILIDLPPITIPQSAGDRDSIFRRVVPEVKPQYIPPGIKLVWKNKVFEWGAFSIKLPDQTYKLPVKFDKKAVDAAVTVVRSGLLKTKVYKSGPFWVVDFPPIKVPI